MDYRRSNKLTLNFTQTFTLKMTKSLKAKSSKRTSHTNHFNLYSESMPYQRYSLALKNIARLKLPLIQLSPLLQTPIKDVICGCLPFLRSKHTLMKTMFFFTF